MRFHNPSRHQKAILHRQGPLEDAVHQFQSFRMFWPVAKFISGYKQARVFIEESKELTKKDLLRFEQLMTEESLSCRGESYDWVKDQYLPIGWKYRRLEGVRQSIVQMQLYNARPSLGL